MSSEPHLPADTCCTAHHMAVPLPLLGVLAAGENCGPNLF